MAFRAPASAPPVRHVVVGPYPGRRDLVVLGAVTAGGLGGLALFAFHASVVEIAVALAIVAAGLLLVRRGRRDAGRIRVTLDPGQDRLSFGSEVLRLGDVADVTIEPGPVPDRFRGAAEAPEIGERLVFVLADGRRVPLRSRPVVADETHRRGFEALRAALALPRTDPPPPPARRPLAPVRWRERPAVLVAIVAALGAAIALLGPYVDRLQPGARLHIRAETRCRFGGMELLPGGEISMYLSPGLHTVEYPTEWGWRNETVTIVDGVDKDYVCR